MERTTGREVCARFAEGAQDAASLDDREAVILEFKPERAHIADYATQPLSICGKGFVADMTGGLYWPDQRTLIVADLQLDAGHTARARGMTWPVRDPHEILRQLAETLDRLEPERVIVLDDSLHQGAARSITTAHRHILEILQEDRQWIWVIGAAASETTADLGGVPAEVFVLGGMSFRYAPRPGHVTHEIAANLHPAARVSLYGHTVRRPCFVGNARRIILPPFGASAGGLNVMDEAFAPLFGNDGMSVWLVGQEGVYPIAARQLRSD